MWRAITRFTPEHGRLGSFLHLGAFIIDYFDIAVIAAIWVVAVAALAWGWRRPERPHNDEDGWGW